MALTPHGTEPDVSDAHGGETAEPDAIENVVNRIFSNRERRLERRLGEQMAKSIADAFTEQMSSLREFAGTHQQTNADGAPAEELNQRLEDAQRQHEQLRRQYEEARQTAEKERRARSEAQLLNAVDRELLRRGYRHPDVLRSYFSEQAYVDDESGRVFIRGSEGDRELNEFLDEWSSQHENAAFLPPLGRGGTGTTSPHGILTEAPAYESKGKTPEQVRQDLLDGHVQLVDPFEAQSQSR